MELAFRWTSGVLWSSCYVAKHNTGFEDDCWESDNNDFYTSGVLLKFSETLCYPTLAPSSIPTPEPLSIPTRVPSSIPSHYPSAYPTQWCDGEEYTDAVGADFVKCGTIYNFVTVLKVEACDEDYQDALYFGIANQLYETCVIPLCVWANLDYAFLWDDEKECYAEVYNKSDADCWSGKDSRFYTSGKLEEKLSSICFGTVPPTPMPTETPSLPPTDDPTGSPTNAPTTFPSPTPTVDPTTNPTQTPTEVPSQTPTRTPTSTPTYTPTDTPTSYPTLVPSKIPTNYPTAFPSHRPSVYPTTGSPTAPLTEKPTVNPTMPWVPRTSGSIFVSANVSCITKPQIAGTIAPLGRVMNVSGQEIGIDSYSKLSRNMTGLEDDGFWIQWQVVLTREDRTEHLVESIKAGDITKELVSEFETEFNNPNCNMIVESITAWSLKDLSTTATKNDNSPGSLWVVLVLACVFIIIALCILCVVLCRRRYKSDKDSQSSDGCPYEEHQDTFAGSNITAKVETANTTTQAGGAVTLVPIKKSKRVSFTSTGYTGNEAGMAPTNGKKTRGSNGTKATKTRGANGTKVTKTRGFEV